MNYMPQFWHPEPVIPTRRNASRQPSESGEVGALVLEVWMLISYFKVESKFFMTDPTVVLSYLFLFFLLIFLTLPLSSIALEMGHSLSREHVFT